MTDSVYADRWGFDEDGTLDEFVAYNVKYLHFEAMSRSSWWMAVELANGELWHFDFGAQNQRAAGYARATLITEDNK